MHRYTDICYAVKTLEFIVCQLLDNPSGITLNNQYTMLKLFLFFTPYKGKLKQFPLPWNVI